MNQSSSSQKKGGTDSVWTMLTLIFVVAIASYTLSLFDLAELAEYKIYDLTFQRRGPVPTNSDSTTPNIVIVTIDQETSDNLSFPFDRKHYATLIKKLNNLGARRICFDVDFSSVGSRPESDSIFKAEIAKAGNVVLIGKIDQQRRAGLVDAVKEVKPPNLTVAEPDVQWGLVNEFVDPDGITRRYGIFLSDNQKTYLSLALKLYAIEKQLPSVLTDSIIIGDFRFGNLSIPRVDRNTTLLNYYGPSGTFKHYSFIHIINGEYDSEFSEEELEMLAESGMLDEVLDTPFKGKIVMVGASAEDLQDNKFTPYFDSAKPLKTPGVEVHANALQMFFDQSFITKVKLWWIVGGVLFLSIVIYFMGRMPYGWIGAIIALAIIGLVIGGGILLFNQYRIWLPVVPLVLAIVIGYPGNLVYRFIKSQKEKAMIRGMFAQYVPKKVVGALINNPELLKLGGERRRLSVLFTDVAGFTTVSEKLTPEELVGLLNEYLTAMTRVILDNDGIIDKYEGDLVMAEFGAPVWYEDHAEKCCRASLMMQRKLAEMRIKWKSEGRIELHSRVGVNTGDMIVGNMGSDEVFDYTVMGDAVNLSSRLEGANKSYKTTIMIGHGTWLDVKDKFITRPLDLLQVKGKTEPVAVYELLGEHLEELKPEKLKAVEHYNKGLDSYRNRDFVVALEHFTTALQVDPTDGPSEVYLKRCRIYIETPPPAHWDGSFELTEK